MFAVTEYRQRIPDLALDAFQFLDGVLRIIKVEATAARPVPLQLLQERAELLEWAPLHPIPWSDSIPAQDRPTIPCSQCQEEPIRLVTQAKIARNRSLTQMDMMPGIPLRWICELAGTSGQPGKIGGQPTKSGSVPENHALRCQTVGKAGSL